MEIENFTQQKLNKNQKIFKKLIKRQRTKIKDIGNYGKLSFFDIKRLDKYIKGDIFNSKKCCIYHGEMKKNYAKK